MRIAKSRDTFLKEETNSNDKRGSLDMVYIDNFFVAEHGGKCRKIIDTIPIKLTSWVMVDQRLQ